MYVCMYVLCCCFVKVFFGFVLIVVACVAKVVVAASSARWCHGLWSRRGLGGCLTAWRGVCAAQVRCMRCGAPAC